MQEKFYDKFNQKKKKAQETAKFKQERKEYNKQRDEYFSKKREQQGAKGFVEGKTSDSKKKSCTDAKLISSESMFDFEKIPKDAVSVLENFDQIVQSVRPMNSKQLQKLPKDIRELSHMLTDERESRRVGYMNATEELSAYIRYFAWWNLVRLTRVFANLDETAFDLEDDDVCIDIGSGPLTVVCALWLARPELRNKKLTFYCMDIAKDTLATGEDLFLSMAAKARPSDENAPAHWNIIRVKGGIGTSIKQKAKFISCANMFNELYQKSREDPADIAKNQFSSLLSYGVENPSIFIAEPGSPVSARFVSLIRENMLKKDFEIKAPCCHQEKCPMSGLHARYGGSAKWCNFSFSTEQAPAKLLKLSSDAGIPKERAVISYIFGKAKSEKKENCKNLELRVASDPIWLPGNRQGYYCCSNNGIVLAINSSRKDIKSGDRLELELEKDLRELEKDQKSGAVMMSI